MVFGMEMVTGTLSITDWGEGAGNHKVSAYLQGGIGLGLCMGGNESLTTLLVYL